MAFSQNPYGTAPFSSRLPTDADLAPMSANCATTLTASVTNSALSLPVASSACFLNYQLVVMGTTPPYETAQICSKPDSTHLTLCTGTRGLNGTTAASHASGQLVSGSLSGLHINALSAWMQAIATALGANLANVLSVGNPANAGYIDLYPPSDAANKIGFVAPPTRSTAVRLQLPSADPAAGQVMACGVPSGSSPPVSTCSWSAPGSMTYPSGSGLPIVSGGASWGTTIAPGAAGHVVRSTGSLWADDQLAFSDLSGNPSTSQVLANFTGTKTSAYCMAGDGTMQAIGGGGGNHGVLDFPAGVADYNTGTLIYGPWKFNGNRQNTLAYGANTYAGVRTTTSGDYLVTEDFRLPPTWTGTGITAYLGTVDIDGNGRSVSYTVAIGCTTSGDSALTNADPTFGTAATISYTQGSNVYTEATASLTSIPAACAVNKIARIKLTRGSFTGNHGVYSLSLVW